MNVEIRKVANGYLVMPMRDHNQFGPDPSKFHVFRNYADLMDKLQEILEAPEPKNDR